MASPGYSRVPSQEGGSIHESNGSIRKWLPWIAFFTGALAMMGYYESASLNPVVSTPALTEEGSEVTEAFTLPSADVVSGGDNNTPLPETPSMSSELDALQDALFKAQKLSDQRSAEARELRLELDRVQATATFNEQSLSQCKEESEAAQLAAASATQLNKLKSKNTVTTSSSSSSVEKFDIDSYRQERLNLVQPNIIECNDESNVNGESSCHLPRNERFHSIGQKGVTMWMTGLSGSGKSTIARALETKLVVEMGLSVQNLDGDNVRFGLNRDLGFTPGDRAESVRRVGEMACLFSGGGVITLVTLVSPYREDRDQARKRHEEQNIPFIEVLMDVPLNVVQERDPKGLYAKALNGELKGMTGMSEDAPYEEPLNPEVRLPNYEMTIEESVDVLLNALRKAGALEGGPTHPLGLPLPYGTKDRRVFLEDELIITDSYKQNELLKEAEVLPKALVGDIEVNWLQVIGEGWAAPLRGFMREGPLMQVLHFNSILMDVYNRTGATDINEMKTNWNDYTTRGNNRASLSVPITLPITKYTKDLIESYVSKVQQSNKDDGGAVALVDKDGRTLAILRNPEIYEHRKEEIVTRCFGAIDMGHPYVQHIYEGGDWLLGGEIELIGKIRYHDGLDKWRLSPKQLYSEFEKRNADVVYAFQTRNPTHAGHAYLMKTGLERLKKDKGYKKPLLWLSPLGGWTKDDDVPLDVRVKQHQAIIDDGMLDAETTVMAIWPAPMLYAGPTEVQFHASSRRNGGASYFVVGRDAAGMKGSDIAIASPDDDLYKGEHARYVLQMSPALEDGKLGLISFDKFYYDTKDHQMKAMDDSRPNDFISISGSKMRKLAAQGATPCPDPIPNDLLAANCIPQGFMVQSGWEIVCDYYQHVDDPSANFLPWSKQVVVLKSDEVGYNTRQAGAYGTLNFQLFLTSSSSSSTLSPWHDVPLISSSSSRNGDMLFNFITEIPKYSTAKMEVNKEVSGNPIMQDSKKSLPRYYKYGTPIFNYGLFPQTWEDPSICNSEDHVCGDDDPLDVIEIGSNKLSMMSVTPVKVLGLFELIDEGETDYKVIVISESDKDFNNIHDMTSLEQYKPGVIQSLVSWLTEYKTSEGKGLNTLRSNIPSEKQEALKVMKECNERWSLLVSKSIPNTKSHYINVQGSTQVSNFDAATSNQNTMNNYYSPPSSSSFSSSANTVAPATSVPDVTGAGGFGGCMALCKSLSSDATMQQKCVDSCVSKYGRRRNLRSE
jgi:3'-phosphoadenosine 5'-phosphosulfate synthase